jgi:hypothetical protein
MLVDVTGGWMEIEDSLRESLRTFAILEDDALEVRAWIQSTTSVLALEAFLDVLGETELQLAYAIHLVESRLKDLNGTGVQGSTSKEPGQAPSSI